MECYLIREWLDVLGARREVRALSSSIGFSLTEATELAIVASELGSNILKYGERGSIAVGRIEGVAGGECGVALVARDEGPPFRNLEMALKDGCDDIGPLDPIVLLKRAGIGGGLGAVLRLTHAFSVHPLSVGKEIKVERYLRPRGRFAR